jgi:hypothetical protein
MMGRGHRSPRAPDNMYSSAESIPPPSDVVAIQGVSVFFCTGKILGGQDHTFMFQDGLANYKAHYNLS